MHYATRYKKRIRFLEEYIKKYYMANYEAKEVIGINPGVCGVSVLYGPEERLLTMDAKGMKQIIKDLPLWDCGV